MARSRNLLAVRPRWGREVNLALDLTTVAALRSITGLPEPDPIEVAVVAARAGAASIGLHMKIDRNHLTDRDCTLVRDVVRVPLWLKISTSQELLRFAVSLKPSTVVLLPERREDLPLDDGLDVILNQSQVRKAQSMLREVGIDVVVFVNPSLDQVKFCHKIDVAGIELNTLKFAESGKEEDAVAIEECARLAHKLGLRVSAGRGLALASLRRVAASPYIETLHVGRLFVARALVDGTVRAIAQLVQAMENGRKAL